MKPANRGPLFFAAAASFVLMAAQAFSFPSPLRDAATGEFVTGMRLRLPAGYLLVAPFSAFADWISFNSVRQHKALAAWILGGYWLWLAGRRALGGTEARGPRFPGRAVLDYAACLACALALLAWAVLSPRAMARLEAGPGLAVVDLHSHTSRSWDGRRSFGVEKNLEWHESAGFHAAFITDHNTRASSLETAGRGPSPRAASGPVRLDGVEAGLHGMHVVVLGPGEINRAPYEGHPGGLARFLRDARSRGMLPVLSLPEYWRNFPRESWEGLAAAGAAGFEIANGSPKALDFPAALRREVVELCRRRNLFVSGATDVHGWGRAAYAWNVIAFDAAGLPSPPGRDTYQDAVITALGKGFPAVRVIERVKSAPLSGAWIAFDPFLGAWTAMRAFGWPQTLSCLAWIWAMGLAWRPRTA